MLTQEKLKSLLSYSPETGLFTWLVSVGCVKAGNIAGANDGRGYTRIIIKNKNYKAHRLAWLYMTGKWPKHQIDHDDHVRDNNRWLNLSDATNSENQKNASLRKDNISGVPGVSPHKQSGKWQSRIKLNGKLKHLGLFNDKFEAICSRKSAGNRYGFHANHGAGTSDYCL